MKLALITPIDMLELATLSDYHLILPHLLENERYAGFYETVEGFKILDNGAAEGISTDPARLIELGRSTNADELVVPDVQRDCEGTIAAGRAFEPYVREGFGYVGVAQGRSVAEIVKCITFYEHTGWITTLALPRCINEIHRTQRFSLIESIAKNFSFDAIHCLGASDWIREVIAIDSTNVVRGMDTSLPIVMGLDGRSVRDDIYVARQGDYFDRVVDRNTLTWKVIDDNVRTYIDWAGANYGGTPSSPSEL